MFQRPTIDETTWEDLEDALIGADFGPDVTESIVTGLHASVDRYRTTDPRDLQRMLREEVEERLSKFDTTLKLSERPAIVLVVGVNGVGKTTTIGKFAKFLRNYDRTVVVGAADTFRAAAVEQLKTWGDRNKVPVVSQGQDADSASVIFDALQAARSRGTQVLIADTAGRLHTQGGLMDELGKIVRVMKKLDGAAPHEVLMVIDGTTGQNAISQLRQFRDTAGVTGLVVTKLDGTAKGGVMFALAREFGLPIRYVGLGETATDLRVFDAAAFVDGLLPTNLGG